MTFTDKYLDFSFCMSGCVAHPRHTSQGKGLAAFGQLFSAASPCFSTMQLHHIVLVCSETVMTQALQGNTSIICNSDAGAVHLPSATNF